MSASDQDRGDRWQQMQDAVSRACQHPAAVMEAVTGAADREEATDALATLLEVDAGLAADLLDLHISQFIGQSH